MNTINITDWLQDEHHGIFPIGARDKEMVWSPAEAVGEIKPKWPYLFKESIYRYPDQYWTELVAYIVSNHLNVDVPRVFPAFKRTEEGIVSGSLIEWFYDVESERFIHGGSYFKRLIPEFDDKTGKHHNLKDFVLILRTLVQYASLETNVLFWLADMALFDALIGNTDRHQENWGIVFKEDGSSQMSPLFDNGTSLGHERFVDNVKNWDKQRIVAYVKRGCHHFRYTRNDTGVRIKHFDLISVLASKPHVKEYMKAKATNLDMVNMLSDIERLVLVDSDVAFDVGRYDWIRKILEIRIELIKEELK